MIFRNKRPRSTLYLMLGMLLLGWPFFKYYIPANAIGPKYASFSQDTMPIPNTDESLVTFMVIPHQTLTWYP